MSILAVLPMILSLAIPIMSVTQASQAQQRPAAGNTTISGTTTSNFQTYFNPVFGIKIKYPSNWLKQDLTRNSSSVFYLVFKLPAAKPLGMLSISGVNHKSSNLTLDTLVRVRTNQLRHLANILHLNSSTPATLAGNPAYKIVFTAITPQGIKFETMQLISVVGYKFYFITYSVPVADYATYLPTIQKLLSLTQLNMMAYK